MEFKEIIIAVVSAICGGGFAGVINLITAPEKKKKEQINNLIAIIDQYKEALAVKEQRQEAYEKRVNKRIEESTARAYRNEHRITMLENALYRARLCKLPSNEQPCPVLVYIEKEDAQSVYCDTCNMHDKNQH